MGAEQLREAVTAVKNRNYLKARTLLQAILAVEPTNEMAWIWLSEASDELGEKVYALKQALAINPQRTAVQQRLTQLEAQLTDDDTQEEQPPLAEVIALAGDGRFTEARDRLLKIAKTNQDDVQIWFLLGLLVDNVEDKIVALENILQLQPYHADAQKLLKQRIQGEVDKVTQGRAAEQREETDKAILAYETAVIISSIEAEREIAKQRLAVLKKAHSPRKTASPNLNLLRLTAGPPILYGLLILVHSGLNPLQAPLVSCLGILVVILGTFLWTAVRDNAQHSLWKQVPPIIQTYHVTLAVIGFTLALMPFLILIMNTINRLEAYQATIP